MNCLNCGAALQGPYCALCGQKHDPHRPSVGHFVAETAETFSHADSRLWATLWQLLSKPGLLAVEFFEGRRARYLPPIRLYLIVSVGFFLLLGIDSGPAYTVNENVTIEGVSLTKPNENQKAVAGLCEKIEYNGPLAQKVKPQIEAGCRNALKDGGATLGTVFMRNLPKAMFVLLPVFALLMLPFYLRPYRLYAEHLVFLLGNHTAIFLVSILVQVGGMVLPEAIAGLLSLVGFLYMVWYCWRGMRVFYGNGRSLTMVKFLILGMLYLGLAGIVLTTTGLISLLET
ncbi:MAG: DUF3667 domain-containing protein [Nevskiaceae bacterium]